MLFSGSLACFSPSVSQAMKKLWVLNGGTLACTYADFMNSHFYFCNDAKDPWLNELLSRSLIVRHASWVGICVAESFRMPLGPYTLDDAFDEAKIPNVDLLKSSQKGVHVNNTGSHLVDKLRLSGSLVKPHTRKRPLDDEHNSDVQRPRKKARVEQWVKNVQIQADKVKIEPIDAVKPSDAASCRISLPMILTGLSKSGRVLRAARAFEMHVAERNAQMAPRTSKSHSQNVHSETLAPHTKFWNDLLAKRYPKDGSNTLILSIEDLVQAPATNVAIFDVNETYLGRRFVNLKAR